MINHQTDHSPAFSYNTEVNLLLSSSHNAWPVGGIELVRALARHVWTVDGRGAKVETSRLLVTWWKDLSPGFNSSIQTGTLCSLGGDGSETRQIHQRLSGYFLNIGARNGDTPESQTKSCVNKSACFISRPPIRLPGPHQVMVLKGVV